MSSSPRIILASGSAYRRELLSRLQLSFEVLSPDVDETPLSGEMAPELAERLARLKAAAVAAKHASAIVIGSDQVADCQGRLLGKPGNEARALEQLRSMQGERVVFHTAVAVQRDEQCLSMVVPTEVRMRTLSDEQLKRYLRREQAFDCAGAFKSEALGIALLASVKSDDPSALIGLPLIATIRLLAEFGLDVL